MRKIKRFSGSFFALLMAVVLLAQTNVVVFAETLATVSGNEVVEAVVDDTANTTAEDGVVALESYNGIPVEEFEGELANTLFTESGYWNEDAFAKTSTLKGVQGDFSGAGYRGSYGSQHTLINVNVTDLMGDGSVPQDDRFEYKGYVYYFRDYKSALISSVNEKGGTISVVILLPLVAGKEILVDPTALNAAQNGGNTKNSPYYAPNVRGEGRRYYEALFAWMAEKWCQEDCHIDNFILGNEVNMPNSWNFTGSTDPQYNVDLYADTYMILYNAVRSKSSTCRVSVSVDHSWQHNDEGRGISTKDFLTRFNTSINARQANVDWCISYHLYPAVLSQPDIWVTNAHMPDAPELDLNPKSENAMFVDGHNLSVMTDYVKNTFGAQHRIMLTEQGFSQYMGTDIQAASLAYSYYAAKYDPMVDCFILNVMNEGTKMNFSLAGTKAEQVFTNLDSNPSWVEAQTLPTIGVSSYAQIVPNYGKVVDRAKVEAYVNRLYELCMGRKADAGGLTDWTNRLSNGTATGASAAQGFFFSVEFQNKNVSDEEYVELLYNVMMGRESDAAGKADWVYKLQNGVGREGVFKGFADSAEFDNICNSYGIQRGTITVSQGRDRNPGLTTFVSRLYTKALGRQYEEAGLNDWCNRILDGQWTINDVSTTGFFNSQEFINKNMSDSEYVKTLYLTFFDRAYDQAGYNDWMNQLANGVDRNKVLQGFANSSEFANLKKSFGL